MANKLLHADPPPIQPFRGASLYATKWPPLRRSGEQGVKHQVSNVKYILILMLSFMISACSYEIKVTTKINDDCSVDILFPDGDLQVEHLLVAEAQGDNFDLSATSSTAQAN